MARRSAATRELIDLRTRIHGIFDKSPLESVAKGLLDLIEGTIEAGRVGSGKSGQDVQVVDYVRQRIDALPQSFGDRFHVDTMIVQTIAEEWSQGPVSLSSTIFPRFSHEWGHQAIGVVHDNGEHHIVNVIILPGNDDLSSVDLLDYPWLCHELGHGLHNRSKRFEELFQPRLAKHLKTLRTRAIADKGIARERSRERNEEVARVWSPTNGHDNWPYEIAVDVVALWICGPAFLAAFQHELDHRQPQPFLITQEHPPYDVRVAALIDAGQRLGWAEFTNQLESTRSRWLEEMSEERSNRYLALGDPGLIGGAVSCALTACDEFQLPRVDDSTISNLERLVRSPTDCDFGVELMIAAWLAESKLDDGEYEKWHETVIRELKRAATQESL